MPPVDIVIEVGIPQMKYMRWRSPIFPNSSSFVVPLYLNALATFMSVAGQGG